MIGIIKHTNEGILDVPTSQLNIIKDKIANSETQNNLRIAAIDDIMKQMQQLKDDTTQKFSTQLIDLNRNSMAFIALLFSLLAFLGGTLGKMLLEHYNAVQLKTIETLHKDELETSKKNLLSMIDIAERQIPAQVFTSIGAYCTYLYMPLPDPTGKQKHLYTAYINSAVGMTRFGYIQSQKMRDSINSTPDKTPTKRQSYIMETCLNNYAYFLAEKVALGDDAARLSKAELRTLVKELEDLSRAGPVQLEPWKLKDTISWAKLHVYDNFYPEFIRVCNELLNDHNVPQDWRDAAKERYEAYRRLHPTLGQIQAAPPPEPRSPQNGPCAPQLGTALPPESRENVNSPARPDGDDK